MKRILLIFLLIPFVNIDLQAQNVGIGTTSPTAKLHLKIPTDDIIAIDENFNDGLIHPNYQLGTRDWEISSLTPFEGPYSIIAPTDFNAGKLPF